MAAVALTASGARAAQVAPAPVLAPTFSEHVAPIFYAKCIGCHRTGGTAPMPLLTFRDVTPFAVSIRQQLLESRMPPWHDAAKYKMLPETPRLTRGEVETIVRWVNEGAREGDPGLLPRMPVLPLPKR